jgi:hypothetical protein
MRPTNMISLLSRSRIPIKFVRHGRVHRRVLCKYFMESAAGVEACCDGFENIGGHGNRGTRTLRGWRRPRAGRSLLFRSCRWRGPAVRGGCAGSRRHSSVGSIKRYISSISVGLVTRGGAPCRNIHLKLKMHVVMQSALACILKLQEDVHTSGYQDVQFMFDMLTSQLESAHACKQPPSPDHGC